MFIDSRSIERESVVETDVCIVGAGVAGLTLGMEFKDANFKTCIIESGGEKPDKSTQALYWGKNIGIPYYELDMARGRFLGGSSHYWGVQLPKGGLGVRLRPLDPIDFETRDWVPYSGWPFDKKHLDPYYKNAQKICEIGPYDYDIDNWEFSDGPKALPFKGNHVKTVIFQFGAREVFYKEYADEIKKSDNVTIMLHGNVTEIETNETASKVSLIHVTCLDGNQYSVKSKIFIIATGGIETPRLLLLSNKVQKEGLGNQNDLVGRFFMEHPHLWLSAFFPKNVDIANSTGLYEEYLKDKTNVMAKIAIDEKTLKKEKMLNWVSSINQSYELSQKFASGYYTQGVLAGMALKKLILKREGKNSYLSLFKKVNDNKKDISKYISNKLKSHIVSSFDRTNQITVYRLNPMVEQAPNPNSRVLLGEEKDALGQRRANLDWQLTELDTYSITRAQEILDGELQKAGLGHLLIETEKDKIPKGIHGGWHHMGTTRMHKDPKRGVVDPNSKVHGISNLFIAGASVFPTSGYANPVLTTIALVLRLADHLKDTELKQ